MSLTSPVLDRMSRLLLALEFDSVVPLGIRQRVIPSLAPKARVSWRLSRLEAAEVRVDRQVETHGYMLQDLGMDLGETRGALRL